MRDIIGLVAGVLVAAVLVGLTALPAHGQEVVVTRSAPVVTYSYYGAPVVVPGPVATTSYYRYGLLGRRGVAVTRYYGAPVVTYAAPAPVVTYYGPPTAVTYYRPRRVVTYYSAPVVCPW